MTKEEQIQQLAKELSRMFYFGWMNGYNDLSVHLSGKKAANPDAVLAKAESEVSTFVSTAEELIDKLKL